MITIKRVKQYNLEARFKYEMAIADWKPEKGGFSFLPMYLFVKDNGEARKNGYVVSNGDSHSFLQARELTKWVNEVPNREFDMVV